MADGSNPEPRTYTLAQIEEACEVLSEYAHIWNTFDGDARLDLPPSELATLARIVEALGKPWESN